MKGHLSKECNFSKQDKGAKEKKTGADEAINERNAASVYALLYQETSACTGAGDNCVLAIVPVRVKSKKSNKVVEASYVFMDSGSSATFCTEALAKQLNVQGRRTELMLSTINSKKWRATPFILQLH